MKGDESLISKQNPGKLGVFPPMLITHTFVFRHKTVIILFFSLSLVLPLCLFLFLLLFGLGLSILTILISFHLPACCAEKLVVEER